MTVLFDNGINYTKVTNDMLVAYSIAVDISVTLPKPPTDKTQSGSGIFSFGINANALNKIFPSTTNSKAVDAINSALDNYNPDLISNEYKKFTTPLPHLKSNIVGNNIKSDLMTFSQYLTAPATMNNSYKNDVYGINGMNGVKYRIYLKNVSFFNSANEHTIQSVDLCVVLYSNSYIPIADAQKQALTYASNLLVKGKINPTYVYGNVYAQYAMINPKAKNTISTVRVHDIIGPNFNYEKLKSSIPQDMLSSTLSKDITPLPLKLNTVSMQLYAMLKPPEGVYLKWTNADATGFILYKSDNNGAFQKLIYIKKANQYYFLDASVQNNHTYTYGIKIVTADNKTNSMYKSPPVKYISDKETPPQIFKVQLIDQHAKPMAHIQIILYTYTDNAHKNTMAISKITDNDGMATFNNINVDEIAKIVPLNSNYTFVQQQIDKQNRTVIIVAAPRINPKANDKNEMIIFGIIAIIIVIMVLYNK